MFGDWKTGIFEHPIDLDICHLCHSLILGQKVASTSVQQLIKMQLHSSIHIYTTANMISRTEQDVFGQHTYLMGVTTIQTGEAIHSTSLSAHVCISNTHILHIFCQLTKSNCYPPNIRSPPSVAINDTPRIHFPVGQML